MKSWKIIVLVASVLLLTAFGYLVSPESIIKGSEYDIESAKPWDSEGCVFQTVMGEERREVIFSDSNMLYMTPENVEKAVEEALVWMARAQHKDGGWGAGSHSNQGEMNPHKVNADPATTSMVAMAILRTNGGIGPSKAYAKELDKAIEYLLTSVETANKESPTITTETGTQIQSKLGANIDVVLTAQFLSNLMEYLENDSPLRNRVMAALNTCVAKIEKTQDVDGSFKGGSWAGVLQTSFATNALESAQFYGATVDEEVLDKAYTYSWDNFNVADGNVNTEKGAGIVLYSVSGSNRASAKRAREVKEKIEEANEELEEDEKIDVSDPSAAELESIGFSYTDAVTGLAAVQVYNGTKTVANDEAVIQGFGNNGGEEFLSFLQTGEGMIINKDGEWKEWYDNTSGRLLAIQNENGSWNGHHCITSPVFCTATCLLVLSVNNDVERLVAMGAEKQTEGE